jgi:hypothetical protein
MIEKAPFKIRLRETVLAPNVLTSLQTSGAEKHLAKRQFEHEKKKFEHSISAVNLDSESCGAHDPCFLRLWEWYNFSLWPF